MKILIVKRDKLGDLLLTTPLVMLLSNNLPKTQIDVWCPSFTSVLVRGFPGVRRVWMMPKVSGFGFGALFGIWSLLVQVFRLRQQKYDWVIAANGEYSRRAIDKAVWVGGRKLVAFIPEALKGGHSKSATVALVPPSHDLHESVRLSQLAGPILNRVIREDECPLPRLTQPDSRVPYALAYLSRWNLVVGQYVVVGLGARKAKRQPTSAQVLSWSGWFKNRGLRTVLSYTPGFAADPGYPSDEEMARCIMAANSEIIPLAGPIEEAIAVIQGAKFSVIPDSGLMHIAAATAGGVIGLYADPINSPNPAQWGPRGKRCQTVVAERSISEVPDQTMFKLFESFLD